MNEFEKYIISIIKKINLNHFRLLTKNVNMLVDTLLKIHSLKKYHSQYKKIIYSCINLTIDDLQKYVTFEEYIENKKIILKTLGENYDIFSDIRVEKIDGKFYYNNNEIPLDSIRFNKYNLSDTIFNYDFSDITRLPSYISFFKGQYTKEIEDVIIKYKSILKFKIDHALTYLPYDFIMKNIYMFCMYSNDARYYLAQNKTLTIDNVFDYISKYGDYYKIFTYANITLNDIITANLHTSVGFYYFSQNSNCTINDINNNPHLDWRFAIDNLLLNNHKYN
jgi:hypothetical protein